VPGRLIDGGAFNLGKDVGVRVHREPDLTVTEDLITVRGDAREASRNVARSAPR
jgi:hypothetical protein